MKILVIALLCSLPMLLVALPFVPWRRIGAWVRAKREARRISRAPVVPMDQLVPGKVQRVTGTIDGAGAMPFPLAAWPCVYWRATIDVLLRQGKPGDVAYVQVAHDEASTVFRLRDGANHVLVDLSGVSPSLPLVVGHSTPFRLPTPEMLEMLARYNVSPTGRDGGRHTFRFAHAALSPGDQISVVGEVRTMEAGGETHMVIANSRSGVRLRLER